MTETRQADDAPGRIIRIKRHEPRKAKSRGRENGRDSGPGVDRRFEPVAIIGMRGRFPGASDLDTFWSNLSNGVESITTLSPEDMRAAGVPDAISRLPGYVNAAPLLERIDEFDAEFFGFSARDAALTDPQHRLFLETCWEALEDAGYDPARYPGAIGLYGGCELSSYLYQLYQNADSLQYIDGMQLMVTNDKDHLCTQASYRLNLRGPSVVVQTTCSTSLVAISLACESLQMGRSDMALAGGVTVRVPQRGGYFYTAGSILSPDGHCRPFDSSAQGTIVGSGVGLVVLKRLSDALAAGDNVRAVILGAGINNDGNDKVGYTAPSYRGQAGAIRAAHAMADVPVESIEYVEAHGTGTILGDPIEFAALNEVFSAATARRGFCGIGSAKSNFGHLSCAAGVAGLIKTVLMLEHGAIPPTVHFKAPNPAIDFANSPFYVTTRLTPWPRNGHARRAGVSSFGVGGTNAHVILEESPGREVPVERRSHQLIVLAARTETALAAAARRLGEHLESHPEVDLADAAFTLQTGRRMFAQRLALVAGSDDRAGLIGRLKAPEQLRSGKAGEPAPVFLFPGQGAQYPGMARHLYRTEPVVRTAIDRCAKLLAPDLDFDIRKVLFPPVRHSSRAAEDLRNTRMAQPALFTVSYALAQLWQSWGVRPAAMIGHSVGEFVAATLAGVFSLEDALKVVALRGRLVSTLPHGSMLSVVAGAEVIERCVDDTVSIAASNAPSYYVLSGPDAAIDALEAELTRAAVTTRRLHTSHAFHSSMMDPILDEFRKILASVPLNPPTLPFVATLDACWADARVAHPDYWVSQLRSTVRFADALLMLARGTGSVAQSQALIEVGPGNTLVTFANLARSHVGIPKADAPPHLTSLPAAQDTRADTEIMLNSLGALWTAGVPVDWAAFHRNESRVRVSLPSYPFERRSYWIGARSGARKPVREHEARDTANWFQRPEWREIAPPAADKRSFARQRVLVLDEGTGLGAAVAGRVRAAGGEPCCVQRGAAFAEVGAQLYTLDPADSEGFVQLADAVCGSALKLAAVIDCWSAAPPGITDIDAAGVEGMLTPMRLAHALGNRATARPLPMLLVARGSTRLAADELVDPPRALGAGVAKVLPQEHPGLRLAHMDVDDHQAVAEQIIAECLAGAPEPVLALRGGKRYAETYQPLVIRAAAPARDLPEKPVVLVTGGLGHMGMILSEAVFGLLGARLVLMGRTPVPPPEEWREKSTDESLKPELRTLLARLATLREQRDEVLVLNADLNDSEQVRKAVDEAFAHFGRIDMLVHGAARIDTGAFASAAETGTTVMEAQFSPKLRGLYYLVDAFKGREPARWVLHSSISTVLGGLGLGAYSAVNAVLDAWALAGGPHWLSVDWDLWENAAEANTAGMPVAIHAPEGAEAFVRLLGADVGQRVLVVVNDLAGRLKAWVRHADKGAGQQAAVERHPRPNLTTAFIEPRNDTERQLAEIWSSQLAVAPIGIHDRFFDLGGQSLLAVQVASEIRDRFEVDLPVLRLFQAPTIGELAVVVDKARSGTREEAAGLWTAAATATTSVPEPTRLEGDAPGVAAKTSYREFYDDVTRKLENAGVGEASFFLNYGYIPQGEGDEAAHEVPERAFNPSSIRLAFELVGDTPLEGRKLLDVGCGRGGTVSLLAERCAAVATGVDLSPAAVAFCRRTHRHENVRFEVGDAENLPFEPATFEVVTNVESSHTYPNLRAFYAEVARVLRKDGLFLYTDLLPVERWHEVRALLPPLGLKISSDRIITPNVLASCDKVAATRAQAFGNGGAAIDNFLAVPGSMVYEQMRTGAWEYRIVRATRT